VAQDLSYDGTALWLHISAGLRGADDRAGRVMSTMTVYSPLMLVMLAATVIVTGEWSLLPVTIGLTVALMLTGLGVGSTVGVLWQWPAPPPGTNPFQKGNSGGLPALLSLSVTMFGTLILTLPTIALTVWSFFTHWVGYLTLPDYISGGCEGIGFGCTLTPKDGTVLVAALLYPLVVAAGLLIMGVIAMARAWRRRQ